MVNHDYQIEDIQIATMNNTVNKLQRALEIGMVTTEQTLSASMCMIKLLKESQPRLLNIVIASTVRNAKDGLMTKLLKLLTMCNVSLATCYVSVASSQDLVNLISSQPRLQSICCGKIVTSNDTEVLELDRSSPSALSSFSLEGVAIDSCPELVQAFSQMNNLKRLNLRQMASFANSKNIETILANSPKLENLIVGIPKSDNEDNEGQYGEDLHMYDIIKKCSKLRNLSSLVITTIQFDLKMAAAIAIVVPQLENFTWHASVFHNGAIEILFEIPCPHLRNLYFIHRNFDTRGNNQSRFELTEIGKLHYEVISIACPMLESFSAPDITMIPDLSSRGGVSSIQSLSIRLNSEDLQQQFLRHAFQHCPNMKRLAIFGNIIYASNFLEICSFINVTSIEIGFATFSYDGIGYEQFNALYSQTPRRSLELLHIHYLNGIFSQFLLTFFGYFSNIEIFKADDVNLHVTEILPWNIEQISMPCKINHIAIDRSRVNEGFLVLLERIAGVRQLRIWSSDISVDVLMNFCQRMDSLEYLDVANCPNLNDSVHIFIEQFPGMEITWV